MGVHTRTEVVLQDVEDSTTLTVTRRHDPDTALSLTMKQGAQTTLLYASAADLAAFFSACINAGFLPEAQPAPLLPDDGYPPL